MYLPAPDEQIFVGVLRLVLRIPGSRSLKDRRRAVAALRDRLVARYGLAVAEVGHLENHEAAVLAVSTVANDPKVVRSRLDQARGDADQRADALLVEHQSDIFPFSGQEK